MNKPTLVAAAAFAFAFTSDVSAQVFSDDFESYSNDTELTAVWTRVSGDATSIGLSNNPENPDDATINQSTAAGRLRHTIAPVTPTDANPLVFSFDLYDYNGGTTTGRTYAEIRQSTGVAGLLAAGIYNSVASGTFTQLQYQARNLDGSGWIQLDAPRSMGWHNFRFEIEGDSVSLFVDGVLDPQFTDLPLDSEGYAYDWLHLGSGLSGNTAAQYDNIVLTVVPEPSTYAMVFGGLTLAGAVVRRRFAKKD